MLRSSLARRRRENELQADVGALRARNLGAIDSWEQVHGGRDFADYALGMGIQSLPYAAEAMAGGLAARGLMSGTRAALGAARAAKDVEEVAALQRRLDIGSNIGAAGASYPSAVGDVLQNQREQNGQTNIPAACGLGVPYAALNVVGPEGALARGHLVRNTIDMLNPPGGICKRNARLTDITHHRVNDFLSDRVLMRA